MALFVLLEIDAISLLDTPCIKCAVAVPESLGDSVLIDCTISRLKRLAASSKASISRSALRMVIIALSTLESLPDC